MYAHIRTCIGPRKGQGRGCRWHAGRLNGARRHPVGVDAWPEAQNRFRCTCT